MYPQYLYTASLLTNLLSHALISGNACKYNVHSNIMRHVEMCKILVFQGAQFHCFKILKESNVCLNTIGEICEVLFLETQYLVPKVWFEIHGIQ